MLPRSWRSRHPRRRWRVQRAERRQRAVELLLEEEMVDQHELQLGILAEVLRQIAQRRAVRVAVHAPAVGDAHQRPLARLAEILGKRSSVR
jgi:hypothetical protein